MSFSKCWFQEHNTVITFASIASNGKNEEINIVAIIEKK
jgi:hypothetical protein